MSDAVIRAAALGDRGPIVRLMQEMKEHHRAFNPEEGRFTVPDEQLEAFVDGSLEDPAVTVLVAEGPEGILGFVCYRIVPKSWGTSCEVDLLSIAEGHRGQGLGTEIMSAVEERAAGAGAAGMRLGVSLGNDGALRFYERLGYAHSSIRLAKDLEE